MEIESIQFWTMIAAFCSVVTAVISIFITIIVSYNSSKISEKMNVISQASNEFDSRSFTLELYDKYFVDSLMNISDIDVNKLYSSFFIKTFQPNNANNSNDKFNKNIIEKTTDNMMLVENFMSMVYYDYINVDIVSKLSKNILNNLLARRIFYYVVLEKSSCYNHPYLYEHLDKTIFIDNKLNIDVDTLNEIYSGEVYKFVDNLNTFDTKDINTDNSTKPRDFVDIIKVFFESRIPYNLPFERADIIKKFAENIKKIASSSDLKRINIVLELVINNDKSNYNYTAIEFAKKLKTNL